MTAGGKNDTHICCNEIFRERERKKGGNKSKRDAFLMYTYFSSSLAESGMNLTATSFLLFSPSSSLALSATDLP